MQENNNIFNKYGIKLYNFKINQIQELDRHAKNLMNRLE